MMQRFTIYLFL